MKKIYALLLCCLCVARVSAQTISATTYPFTNTTGTSLVNMSSGTTQLIGAGADDPVSSVFDIGFDFWFNGVRYTQFSVNGNGLLRLGATNVLSTWTNDVSNSSNNPFVTPYWDDLRVGTDGGMYYKVTGTAPNRVLVVEWQNVSIPRPTSAQPGNASFQCWLTESTGTIDFVYGAGMVDISSTTYNYSIGFGSSGTQFASVTSSGPTCAYGSANNAQTNAIASGTKYTFTPLVPAAPSSLTFSSVAVTAMTLNWTDNSSNEVGFVIYYSTDGVNYSFLTQTAANATSYAATGLAGATLYYFKVHAVTEGALSTPLSGSQSTAACGMSGTYVVGPTGAYATIAAAFADLQTLGATGAVTLELQTTYAGETYPITLGNVPCASATSPIVIRPQGTLTITGSGAPVFDLNGVKYLTIDGRVGSTGTTKALTIANTTNNAANIRFSNGASNDVIKHCTLVNVNNTTSTGTIFFSTSTGSTGNSNNLIDSCDFVEGATPYAQGIYASGTSGKENNNNTISNCNFAGYFSAGGATAGINIAGNNSGWTINNNRFYQTATRTYTTTNTHRAIYINNTSGNGFTVTNNIIGYGSSAGTGTYSMTGTVATTFNPIELSVGTTTPSSVQGNIITNISLSGTSGSLTAIRISNGSVNVGTVTGNTIGSATGTGAITIANTTTTGNIMSGIGLSSPSPAVVNIQNNNIGGLTATGSTTSIASGITGIAASSSATVTISGNTIGSTTTANSINSNTATTGAVTMNVYGINSSLSSACTISNNTIANLNCAATSTSALMAGILHSGSGAATISGNTVRNLSSAIGNTTLAGQPGMAGIAYTGSGAATVTQNTVNIISNTNTGSVQSNVAGIYYSGSSNGSVTRNNVYDLRNASAMTTAATPPTATGLLVNNPAGTATILANNMISLGNGQTTNTQFMGIANVTNTTSVLRVYHNSINIEGTASGGALPTIGFNRGNNSTTAVTSTIDLKNNIINNTRTGGTGKHYAIVNGLLVTTGSATGWAAGASNNNVLNANSSTVGFWSSDKTLATWRTASAGDALSYNGLTVTFTNTATGDLHLNMGTTPNYLEGHGAVVTVTNDYDNDSRPGPAGSVNGGGIAPDLGADEFDGVAIDDVVPVITYTALSTTCSTGDRTLTATIADQSGVPAASSGSEPRIYYKKGLSGTWYSRPGTLSSGTVTNGTWSFPIVATDMGVSPADRVYYYVAAQDVMSTPNVGANPGAGFAATNVTTIGTHPTTPNNYFVSYATGTFNVGAGQPFTTITEAVNSYNTNTCLTGPVTFLLTDAAYSTSETFPITINNNPLASSTATLTIKPATGVAASVTSASGPAIFKFLNARYVTLNGVNASGSSLALINNNTGTGTSAVWLASTSSTGPGNNNISLLNMSMTGGATNTTNWGIVAGVDGASPAATNGMDNDSVTIQGNTIKKCGYAIMAMGTATTAAGGLNNWVIRNNILGPSVYSATDNIGYNGMFMRNMTDVAVSGNTMQNIGFTSWTSQTVGIYMEAGVDGIVIDSNIVDSVLMNGTQTGTTSVVGFYLGSSVKNATISRNKISSIYNLNTSASGGTGARGITVNNATAASNVTIVNNFVSDIVSYANTGTAAIPIGIGVDGTSGGVNIYHNSINLYGPHAGLTGATNSADIFISATGGNIDVRNNVLVNSYENTSSTTDKSYTIYSTAANTVFTNIDYNDYYPTGGTPIMGNIGGTDRPTLTDMIAGFGGNTHSINEAAAFTSSTDLHIPAGTTTPLESAGVAISGLTTDIDNQVRPGPAGSTYGGGTNPDLGADEADCVPVDAVAPLCNYTGLSVTTCSSGDRTLTGVSIMDAGGVPTSGLLVPRIYFKKNSGSWYSNAGTLSSGTATNGIWSFTIPAATMGGLVITDVISYYVIAQDVATIPNISAYPGVGLSATDVNTVSTPPTTPFVYTITPTLNGTYTVGASGTYTTLTSAINDYNIACLAGPVTFVLTDASYSTAETFPLTIKNNSYASASTMLTIKPATGVATTVTSGSGSAAVFKLLNAKYVTIDGVNTGGSTMSLVNGNTGTNTADVWLASTSGTGPGNSNIWLINMNMNGGATNTTNNAIVAGIDGATPASTDGMNNDSVTIVGNTIKKVGYAIMARGIATTGTLDGWVIRNNTFGPATYSTTDNLGYNGVFLRNMTNVVVSGNTIRNVGFTTSTSQTVGIYMETGVDGATLDSNIISTVQTNSTGSTTSSVCGIYLGTSVINTTLSRNKISAIYNVNINGYGARAIIVNTGNASSNVNIVNNFVSDVASYSDPSADWWPIGISINGSTGGVKVYNNTVHLYGTHSGITGATGDACLYVNATGGNIDVRNNIFANSYDFSTSTTDKSYAIYSSSANTVFSNIDYNDYYVSGDPGTLGNIGAADRTTMADIIAGFGGNANSINTSPLFVSSTDLHLQAFGSNVPLISGTPLAAVTTDIDGTTRSSTTPVMGGHEVNIPACSGTPVPGTVAATALSGCGSFSSNLSLSGSSTTAGITYQWQSSPDSSTWTNISGATDMTYAATGTVSTYYRAVSTCTVSTSSDVTPGVQIVVNTVPAITGSTPICVSTIITLSATPTGGTWSSANTSIATVGAGTGIVTGVAAGTVVIDYVSAAGCAMTTIVTVNPSPSAITITPASSQTVCLGDSAVFTAVSLAPAVVTMGNDFNTSIAPWTVDNTGSSGGNSPAESQWLLRPSGYSAASQTHTPPDATQFIVAVSDAAGSGTTTQTRLTSPAFSLVGYTSASLTFSHFYRYISSDVTARVEISTDGGGTWTTLQDYRTGGVSVGSASSFASANLNLDAYLGQANCKIRFFYHAGYGWSWALDNVKVNTVSPSTYAWTGISGADGLSCTSCGSPTITPTAAGANVYSVTATANGCSTTSGVTVSVNPLPAVIGGGTAVCHGLTSTLTNSDGGGTWTSTNTSVATIDATTGVMTGVNPGTALISYTFTATGCTRTTIVTVNALPSAIGGVASVCEAATTLLTNSEGGGTWSSGTLTVATVNAASGEVSGVAAGLSIITYTLPTSCIRTTEVTVNPLPVVNITPGTSATICQGESASFTVNAPLMEFSLLNQNFNAGLGTWVITTPTDPADGVSPWELTSASAMGIAGDGTAMVEAAPFASTAGDLTKTYLTSPSFSTIGFGSANLTFNEHLYSTTSADVNVKVQYSTDGGSTWNTLADQYPVAGVDTTVGTGTWVASSPEVVVPLPAGALNVPDVRLRWFYETNWGGWWEIDNIAVKAALPAATFAWAGVGSADGLTCTTCTTPTITPTVPGANVYNVTASSTCSTTTSVTVNMNPLPTINGATSLLCTGKTITLSSTITGGTWASSDNAIATVNTTTGAVFGVATGSVVITYTLPTLCSKTVTLNVNQSPDGIGGSVAVCEGSTTTLYNLVTGGTWSSANTSVATVDMFSGVVTGLMVGSSSISYILPSGCFVRATSQVRPLPTITGSTSLLCEGSTITLGGSIAAGTWASSNNAVATVNATTGVVTGVSAGSVVISYTLPTLCASAVTLNVNQSPGAVTGALHICEGLTTALGNAVGGGTWSSSNLGVATINSLSGLTTAVGPGTTTVSYVLPSGCHVSDILTVDMAPTAFTGGLVICESSTTTLGTTPTGGTWTSDAPTVANVDMTTGALTGVANGTANIVYTSGTGCVRSEVATVNPLPVDIAGTMQVCEGLTTALINTTGGGTWSSSDLAIATVDAGGIVTGVAHGTSMISYIITGTGCYKTAEVTVNALPDAIPGPIVVCEGLTTTLANTPAGGTWASSDLAVATMDAATGVMTGVAFGTTIVTYTLPTGCISTAEGTVNPLPATTTGVMQVCHGLTTNLTNTTLGGTWSSDDILVAGVDATGMVTGNTPGTANILYTLPTGCLNSVTVTVNQLPEPIGGTLDVCEGLTTSLTNTVPGGTWSSAAPLTASVDPLTGIMSGVAAGNATITYTLMTGCIKVADATVNALPAMITGTLDVCEGSTTTLFNTTPGGTWSNDLSGMASVNTTGVVTGIAGGTASIAYTLGTGCMRTAEVTVNVLPTEYSVTGGGAYCATTSGSLVGLGNSDVYVNYDLYQGATLVGSAMGTGSAISFGAQSVVGTYTVFATNTLTSCANDMAGSAVVTVTPLNIPSVTVTTTSAATTVCSGIAITYTATPVNGGTLPVYNWEVNGAPVSGVTSATYSYYPNNGDVVKVTLNSNEICAIPSTATDMLTMTVNTSELPIATISVPNTTVCAGSGASFSVAPTFGGTAPTYEWFVDGLPTGVTSTVYTYVPSNGDAVTCKMTSNFTCRLADVVTSNSLLITTTPISLPIVSLAVSPSSVFNYGTPVTFTATITGAGSATPTYQWLVNGVAQSSTSSTFTSSMLNNNDSVTCKVFVSVPCGYENFNSIVVRVKPVGVAEVFGAGDIRLVPNPNQGEFIVKGTVASANDEEVFVEVVDMLGQIVYRGQTVTRNGALNERIKLSNTLANGMYMLNLRTATESAVFHFVLEQQ